MPTKRARTRKEASIELLAGVAFAIGLFCVQAAGATANAEAEAAAPAPAQQMAFDGYLEKLEAMRETWRSAAEAVHAGDISGARWIMNGFDPAGLGERWIEMHRSRTLRLGRTREHGGPWFMDIEHPELALEHGPGSYFAPAFMSQCHIELGDLQSARQELEELEPGSPFWNRRQLLDDRLAGELDELSFLRSSFGSRERPRILPILITRRLELDAEQEQDRRELFAHLLRGDDAGLAILYREVAENERHDARERAQALFNLGSIAMQSGDFEATRRHWNAVIAGFPGTGVELSAAFHLSALERREDRPDAAMAALEAVMPAAPAADAPQAAPRMPSRNLQWELGHVLLALGRPQEALAAYRAVREVPGDPFLCGNAVWEESYRLLLFEGVSYEHLGNHAAAVERYWEAEYIPAASSPMAGLRLFALYERADQLDDLQAMLPAQNPPAVFVTMLKIRQLEVDRDWEGLIDHLVNDRTSYVNPAEFRPHVSVGPYHAANALARHADETVPLLIERFKDPEGLSVDWLAYALAVTEREDAVAVVRERARRDWNAWRTRALLYTLTQGGEEGAKAIETIEQSPETPPWVKQMIERYQSEGWMTDEQPPFPAIPDVLRLPGRLVVPE